MKSSKVIVEVKNEKRQENLIEFQHEGAINHRGIMEINFMGPN